MSNGDSVLIKIDIDDSNGEAYEAFVEKLNEEYGEYIEVHEFEVDTLSPIPDISASDLLYPVVKITAEGIGIAIIRNFINELLTEDETNEQYVFKEGDNIVYIEKIEVGEGLDATQLFEWGEKK